MPKVSQIKEIVNEIARQSMGDAIANVDTMPLVDIGRQVLAEDGNVEKFSKTLVDRIGKTIVSTRTYSARGKDGILVDPIEWGCILQKLHVKMPEAKENNSWEIGEKNYQAQFAPVSIPEVDQTFFSKISTWEVPITIPDYLYKTAFTSEADMGAFVDSMFTQTANSIELALENNIKLTRATFIAHKLKSTKDATKINLLEQYNDMSGSTLTASSALYSMDFLKFASMQVKLWIRRMQDISKNFNEKNFDRFTPESEVNAIMLADFADAASVYLQSDTYHDELVKMPLMEKVSCWQAAGSKYAFDEISSIDIKIGDTESVKQSGVLAVVHDRQAIGVTIKNYRTTTERNSHDEYTNHYHKADIGYYNDLSENGIVFYIAD